MTFGHSHPVLLLFSLLWWKPDIKQLKETKEFFFVLFFVFPGSEFEGTGYSPRCLGRQGSRIQLATLCPSWWSMKNKANAVGPHTFLSFIGSGTQPEKWGCSLSGQPFPSQLHLPGDTCVNTSRGVAYVIPAAIESTMKMGHDEPTTCQPGTQTHYMFLKLIQNFWISYLSTIFISFHPLALPTAVLPLPSNSLSNLQPLFKLLCILFTYCRYK